MTEIVADLSQTSLATAVKANLYAFFQALCYSGAATVHDNLVLCKNVDQKRLLERNSYVFSREIDWTLNHVIHHSINCQISARQLSCSRPISA